MFRPESIEGTAGTHAVVVAKMGTTAVVETVESSPLSSTVQSGFVDRPTNPSYVQQADMEAHMKYLESCPNVSMGFSH